MHKKVVRNLAVRWSSGVSSLLRCRALRGLDTVKKCLLDYRNARIETVYQQLLRDPQLTINIDKKDDIYLIYDIIGYIFMTRKDDGI